MLENLRDATNFALTENGAVAYASTNSEVLDLFSRMGAMRKASDQEIVRLVSRAFAEDKALTMKALFYNRDIRGGLGERRFFRVALQWLANNHPNSLKPNIRLIPEYGRWDDLLYLYGTPVEQEVASFIRDQWVADLTSHAPTLMAKWLPSENASSAKTKRLADKTRKLLGLTPRQYRKGLSAMRKKINVLERLMSANQWQAIEYDKIPSKAGLIYRAAFNRHDGERYAEFLQNVRQGQVKINADTLYPYEIVEKIMRGSYYVSRHTMEDIATFDAMWNALPDYYNGRSENALVVADVSGSMAGRPMAIAISLAIYAAERNKGRFHNYFVTFSRNPKLQKVIGNNIVEKVENLSKADWGMNTNVEAVFDLILSVAVKNNLPQSELPNRIYIVSDMEFDKATGLYHDSGTLFTAIAKRYSKHGYTLPQLIFWNADSRNQQVPFTMNSSGVVLVSGASASIFEQVLNSDANTPYEYMLKVLNSPRYAPIVA